MERSIKRAARIYDPAFRTDATACAVYGRTREESDMPLRDPGTPPVWFHYRRLTRSQVYRYVEAAPTDSEKLVRAFQCGVVKVEGGPWGTWAPAEATRQDHDRMADDELDAFGLADLEEIGAVVLWDSKRPKDLKGGFALAPSSAQVWDAAAYPSADARPPEPGESSEKPKGD